MSSIGADDAKTKNTGSGDQGSAATSNVSTTGSAFASGDAGPSLPAVSVPSGGGTLRTMEEAFDLDLVTGTAGLRYGIPVTRIARWGAPNLELVYSSGGGSSAYGMGWTLAGLPSISRSTKLGFPTYLDERDIFELDGAELVPCFAKSKGELTLSTTGDYSILESNRDGYTVRQYKRRQDHQRERIERWTSQENPTNVHWRVIAGDNTTQILGYDPKSRSASGDKIYVWRYDQGYDSHGNAQLVQYKSEDGENVDKSAANERNRTAASRQPQSYPKRIFYGNKTPNRNSEWAPLLPSDLAADTWLFELVLDYGEHDKDNPKPQDDASRTWPVRKDPFSSYQSGFELRKYRLCHRFLMFHHFATELKQPDYLVSSYNLGFDQDESLTYLNSLEFVGYKARAAGGYITKSLPPTEFTYTRAPTDIQLRDLSLQTFDKDSLRSLPSGLATQLDWLDLFGDGTTGVLARSDDAWYYKRNLSTATPNPDGTFDIVVKLGDAEEILSRPNINNSFDFKVSFQDLDGDGSTDLLITGNNGINGFFRSSKQVGNISAVWESFQTFSQWPSLDMNNPNLRQIDLTGTGKTDLLVTTDDVFIWHQSLGQQGYGPEQRVAVMLDEEQSPRVLFSDMSQSIHLADMSGDGLVDIVRIRNQQICYWPNLGRGVFGSKVTMDHAPVFDHEDSFSPTRLLLGDVDGSGTTDLLYFGQSGAKLYYNEAGNSWKDPLLLPALVPRFDSVTKISAINLLGTGMCLIWQSTSTDASGSAFESIQYIDITCGVKPHLLKSYINNKGLETSLTYQTSTSYYLRDEQEGKPWLTTIPTPVHCVDKVIKYDHLSKTRMTHRLRYHHGYYDGIERAFCGFGMVEKWDTEEFDVLASAAKDQAISNFQSATYVPPLHSKTWYHVGAYKDSQTLRTAYAREFHGNSEPDASSAPHVLDHNLSDKFTSTIADHSYTDEELRQATYALRGNMIRQEIYSDLSTIPHTVGEFGNTVLLTQPQGRNAFISCYMYQHESLASNFDNNIASARTVQQLKLLVDEYGNTLKSVSINYGRGAATELDLDNEDLQRQQKTRITYNEANYTNSIDKPTVYLLPALCDTRTFELVDLQAPATIFTYADFAGDGSFSLITNLPNLDYFQDGVDVIAFNGTQLVASRSQGKRLVSSSRRYFRSEDLSRRLALGELQSLAVLDQEYKLCLTPSMLSAYEKNGLSILPNEAIFSDLRYVDLDADGSWWVPSGKQFFSVPNDDELTAARSSFFQSRRSVDVYGNSNSIDYDTYQLLPVHSTDACGNHVSGTIDYWNLMYSTLTDVNDNRTEFAYDALNTLVGIAVVGKDEAVGDSLREFNPDMSQEEVDAHFSSLGDQGSQVLGTATSCYLYDAHQFHRNQQPAYVATIHGETVGGAGKNVQISVSYSNGSGKSSQTKSKADEGQWRVSGCQIVNNKGNPVELYYPLFSKTHTYEAALKSKTRQLIFYDARDRVTATLSPDHTWTKTSYSNWSKTFYSENNLVDQSPADDPDVGRAVRSLDPTDYSPTWYELRQRQEASSEDRRAAQKALVHKGKSLRKYVDTMGQIILTVSETTSSVLKQRSYFNSEGRNVVLKDASDRIAQQCMTDMLGHIIASANIDKGWSWTLCDAMARETYSWNTTSQHRQTYDKISRPTHVYYKEQQGSEICVSMTQYGEELDEKTAKAKNLRGEPYKLCDQSGVRINQEYDLRGVCKQSTQQLATEYKINLDWSTDVELDSTIYTSSRTSDALGRVVFAEAPDKTQKQYFYDESGHLSRIMARNGSAEDEEWESYISATLYDEQGRVISQMTGNGIITLYTYDNLSQRLVRKKVENGSTDIQRLQYVYDANGNIVYQLDRLKTAVFFRNARVTADNEYTYDNLGRLIEATGREHIGQTRGQPFSSSIGASTPITGQTAAARDGAALARYTETYEFDNCGNILQIRHDIADSQSSGWTRRLTYIQPSKVEPEKLGNGLSSSTIGNITEGFTYDEHGNTLSMATVSRATWDPYQRLKSTVTQNVRNGTPETIYYTYDITGSRVRKVVERASDQAHFNTASKLSQTCYLDSTDHIQKFDGQGNVSLECWTSKVVADSETAVLIEQWSGTLKAGKGLPSLLVRYQYHDASNSVFVELDSHANTISYEEYTPYGSTSYRANIVEAPKRYRYAGKERDHETGFYYNEQRYYLPWLCRWLNPDPAGMIDGFNLYAYVDGNPISYVDPAGTCPKKQVKRKTTDSKATKVAKQKEEEEESSDDSSSDESSSSGNGGHETDPSEDESDNEEPPRKAKKGPRLSPEDEEAFETASARASRGEKRSFKAARAKGKEQSRKLYQKAHIFPKNRKIGEPETEWGLAMIALFKDVPAKDRLNDLAIRVPASTNLGILKDVDNAWNAWLAQPMPFEYDESGEDGFQYSRKQWLMNAGYSKNKDLRKAARAMILAEMPNKWTKKYIPWKDVQAYAQTWSHLSNVEGTSTYKAYEGWDPGYFKYLQTTAAWNTKGLD